MHCLKRALPSRGAHMHGRASAAAARTDDLIMGWAGFKCCGGIYIVFFDVWPCQPVCNTPRAAAQAPLDMQCTYPCSPIQARNLVQPHQTPSDLPHLRHRMASAEHLGTSLADAVRAQTPQVPVGWPRLVEETSQGTRAGQSSAQAHRSSRASLCGSTCGSEREALSPGPAGARAAWPRISRLCRPALIPGYFGTACELAPCKLTWNLLAL